MNNPAAWEFAAGHRADGQPVWSSQFADLKPLLTWEDKSGLAHVLNNALLKKYLMWISPLLRSDTYIIDVGPTNQFSAEGSLLLEED